MALGVYHQLSSWSHWAGRDTCLPAKRAAWTKEDSSKRRDGGWMTPTFFRRPATIDWGGQFLFLFEMGLLLQALSWGGSYYAWTCAKVMASLVVGLVLIIVYAVYEHVLVPG